jgi:hypothetical protein
MGVKVPSIAFIIRTIKESSRRPKVGSTYQRIEVAKTRHQVWFAANRMQAIG